MSRPHRLLGFLTIILGAGITILGSAGPVPAQTFTNFPTPTPNSTPSSVTAGPDGNLWFAENSGQKIGRISLNAGPDGTLWFTDSSYGTVGVIDPALVSPGTAAGITVFPIPAVTAWPFDIAPGPDGAMWFTQKVGNLIGRRRDPVRSGDNPDLRPLRGRDRGDRRLDQCSVRTE